MREPTDERTVAQLVVAAQAGDDRSWDELVGRYDGMVHAVAIGFRLQEADVADAAQGTWLRAVEQLHTVRDPERFGGWLRTIAHRECVGVRAGGRRDHLDARVGEHVVEPEPVTGRAAEKPVRSSLWRSRRRARARVGPMLPMGMPAVWAIAV